MERPNVVDILGIPYYVNYSREAIPPDAQTKSQKEKGEEATTSIVGMTDNEKQLIIIDDQLGSDYVAETLLHEVLHALFYIVDAGLSYKTEEKIIRILSPVLLSTLRHNPKLVSILVGDKSD